MKKEIEISAKTKEEAIEKAAIELGAPSPAAIMYTVINEGRKGFLGFGAVDCTIRAVYQVADPTPEKPPRERRERGERRDRGDRRDRRDRRDGDRRDSDRASRKAEAAEEETVTTPVIPPVENIDPATATESEQTAYRFICKLVEDMELADVTVAMHPGRNDDMVITVDGEAAGVLIGHHGDTLDALQYLANLAANRKEEGEKREYARITVDVESYRAKREEALRILARKKAHQVLKYKKSIMLEPMNPYERRIIHSAVSAMEGLVKMDYSKLEAALGAVQSRIGEAPELHDVWIRLYDAVAQGRPLLTSGDQTAVDEAVVKLNELLEELSGYGYVSTAEPEVIIQEVEVEVLPTGDFCNIPMHRTWPVLFFISAALNVGLMAALIFVILRKRNTMDDTPLVSYDIDDDMDF